MDEIFIQEFLYRCRSLYNNLYLYKNSWIINIVSNFSFMNLVSYTSMRYTWTPHFAVNFLFIQKIPPFAS